MKIATKVITVIISLSIINIFIINLVANIQIKNENIQAAQNYTKFVKEAQLDKKLEDLYFQIHIQSLKNSSLDKEFYYDLWYIFGLETLLIIFTAFIFTYSDIKRLRTLIDLFKNISVNNFASLQNFKETNSKNEIYILEKNVVEMAKKLEASFSTLETSLDKFQFEADHDTLTGLLNKRALDDIGLTQITSVRFKTFVVMLDIDRFRAVNDTYGHDQGDIILSRIAEFLKNSVRADDLIIRYGGEEFCIILRNTTRENARVVTEKIRMKIHRLDIEITSQDKKKEILNITVSLGISECKEEDSNIYEVISRADEELYKAKEDGRNRVKTDFII